MTLTPSPILKCRAHTFIEHNSTWLQSGAWIERASSMFFSSFFFFLLLVCIYFVPFSFSIYTYMYIPPIYNIYLVFLQFFFFFLWLLVMQKPPLLFLRFKRQLLARYIAACPASGFSHYILIPFFSPQNRPLFLSLVYIFFSLFFFRSSFRTFFFFLRFFTDDEKK